MKKQYKSKKSFLDLYVSEIEPIIKNLDIVLKGDREITSDEFAEIIGAKTEDITKVLQKHTQKTIGKHNIIKIMSETDNDICQMIKREIECGSPSMYSAKEIAYIYKIDRAKVDAAFDFIECERISGKNLPAVFAQIIL